MSGNRRYPVALQVERGGKSAEMRVLEKGCGADVYEQKCEYTAGPAVQGRWPRRCSNDDKLG